MSEFEGNESENNVETGTPKLPVYSVSPKFIWVPVIVCIIFSGLLAYLVRVYAGLDIQYEPVEEEKAGFIGNVINALIFIGIGVMTAFIIIKLVRKKGIGALEKLMKIALLLLSSFIIWIYGEYGLAVLDNRVFNVPAAFSYVWIAIAVASGIFITFMYSNEKFDVRARNIAVLIYGILVGSYLPIIIGGLTSLLILIGFALYDIYSVRRGPIKEMMEKIRDVRDTGADGDSNEIDLEDLTIDIGIGDLAFYSMLTSLTLIDTDFGGPAFVSLTNHPNLYLIPFVFTVAGVLIGVFISIELVKKSKILPGLPLSIFIGIGLLFLSLLLGFLLFK
ncbi:MAG: hypothetical protein ACTSXP_07925 [Promethearchaeota archaeon]